MSFKIAFFSSPMSMLSCHQSPCFLMDIVNDFQLQCWIVECVCLCLFYCLHAFVHFMVINSFLFLFSCLRRYLQHNRIQVVSPDAFRGLYNLTRLWVVSWFCCFYYRTLVLIADQWREKIKRSGNQFIQGSLPISFEEDTVTFISATSHYSCTCSPCSTQHRSKPFYDFIHVCRVRRYAFARVSPIFCDLLIKACCYHSSDVKKRVVAYVLNSKTCLTSTVTRSLTFRFFLIRIIGMFGWMKVQPPILIFFFYFIDKFELWNDVLNRLLAMLIQLVTKQMANIVFYYSNLTCYFATVSMNKKKQWIKCVRYAFAWVNSIREKKYIIPNIQLLQPTPSLSPCRYLSYNKISVLLPGVFQDLHKLEWLYV